MLKEDFCAVSYDLRVCLFSLVFQNLIYHMHSIWAFIQSNYVTQFLVIKILQNLHVAIVSWLSWKSSLLYFLTNFQQNRDDRDDAFDKPMYMEGGDRQEVCEIFLKGVCERFVRRVCERFVKGVCDRFVRGVDERFVRRERSVWEVYKKGDECGGLWEVCEMFEGGECDRICERSVEGCEKCVRGL